MAELNNLVTKEEFHTGLQNTEEKLRREIDSSKKELRSEMNGMELRLRTEIKAGREEIIQHFNTVAEQMRYDLTSASADELSSTKEKIVDHEKRISNLEKAC